MKFEQTWKIANSIKDIPYSGTFLANFNSSKGLQTTFIHGRKLFGYPDEEFPIEYCKIPEDSEVLAKFVSETFSATGYILGITWENVEVTKPLPIYGKGLEEALSYLKHLISCNNLNIGAILSLKTTTTVSIQGHLFSNISETIEFVGELTEEQKETLRSLL